MKHSLQRLAMTLLALCAPLYMGAEGCETAMVGTNVCETDAGLIAKGDSFNDGCNECTCEGAGRITCTERACGEPTCMYDGKVYEDGDSFPSDDGCNTCSCGPDGQVACTLRACAPGGCTFGGKRYDEGDTFPDDCNTCSCNAGQVSCTDIACAPNGCDYDGQHYEVGDSFPSSDGCNTCSCSDGGLITCTERACAPGCVVDGMQYDIGAELPKTTCNQCWCAGGNMTMCTMQDCMGGGTGCDVNGQHYEPNESWSDGCNGCSCGADGLVACTANWCEPEPGSCMLGDRSFPPNTSVICEDGCNRCACDGNGQWSTTLIGCPALVQAELCDDSEGPGDPQEAVHYLSSESHALALQATYGGGCVDHTFKLCFSGFTGTDPQTTRLWLVDETGEPDPCDAIVNVDRVFDITPVRDAFVAQHPSLIGPLTLQVGGAQLSYDY